MADKLTKEQIDQRVVDMLHHRAAKLGRGESIAPPLVHASTFHLPGETDAPFQYGRYDQPTWQAAEELLGVIEQAEIVSFPAGMAAISSVLYTQLKAGMTVITPADGYHAGRILLEKFFRQYDIEAIAWPTADMLNAPFEKANLVWIETPSNPMLNVCDIRAVAKKAHAAGASLMADNTTATPLLQQPLDLGSDIVVAADTKAPAGHSDAMFGHVASRNEKVIAEIREWRKLSGVIPSPMDAWLTYRGLKTLDVRLERMCATAFALAERLAQHPNVIEVRYPGLKKDPSHEIATAQMAEFGFLIGITLAGQKEADSFIDTCRALVPATSFGSVQSYAERRNRWGDDVAPGFVRLSIGCEPLEVLWHEIDAALGAIA